LLRMIPILIPSNPLLFVLLPRNSPSHNIFFAEFSRRVINDPPIINDFKPTKLEFEISHGATTDEISSSASELTNSVLFSSKCPHNEYKTQHHQHCIVLLPNIDPLLHF